MTRAAAPARVGRLLALHIMTVLSTSSGVVTAAAAPPAAPPISRSSTTVGCEIDISVSGFAALVPQLGSAQGMPYAVRLVGVGRCMQACSQLGGITTLCVKPLKRTSVCGLLPIPS